MEAEQKRIQQKDIHGKPGDGRQSSGTGLPQNWLSRSADDRPCSLQEALEEDGRFVLTERSSGLAACAQPLPAAEMKPRLKHVLHKAGLHTWQDLLSLSAGQVRQLPGMGAVSLEQLEKLGQACLIRQPVSVPDPEECRQLEELKQVLVSARCKDLAPLLNQVPVRQVRDLLKAVSGEEGMPDALVLVHLMMQVPSVRSLMEEKVLARCEKALPWPMAAGQVSALQQQVLQEDIVPSLLERKKLFETPLGLVHAQCTLEDWLASLKEPRRQVLQLRLQEGLTLEKTAARTGLSPRQVRGLLQTELARAPLLPCHWLLPYFEKYSFSLEEAEEIFGLPPAQVRFLRAAALRPKKSARLEELLQEPDLSVLLYRRIHVFIHRTDLRVDGIRIPRQRRDLLRHLVRREAGEQAKEIPVLYEAWQSLLKSLGLEQEASFVFASSRNFELYLYQVPWTVSSGKHRVRWYDTSRINWAESVRRMNLEQYRDQVISARLIFEARRQQMELLDIRDCYELHHILKKTRAVWDPQEKQDIVFERSPSLIIGQGSREKQIRLLLEELAPVSRDDLAAAYAERYGDLQSTVTVNVLPLVKEYLDQGQYVLEQPALSAEEQALLCSLLQGEPASLAWLRMQCAGKIRDERSLCASSLAAAGYVMKTGYVLPQDRPDPETCLLEMAQKRGHFHFRQDLHGLGAIPRFVQALGQLRQTMQLFECAPSVYESRDVWLARWPGLEPALLEDYLKTSRAFAKEQGMRRFNDFGLRRRGFAHPVYESGVPCEQLDLLRKNTKQMIFQRTGGQLLFAEKSFSASSMIYRALTMQEGQSAAQLQKMSQDWWNMTPPLDKVEEVLRNTGFYQRDGLWYTSKEAWSAAVHPDIPEETEPCGT